MRYLTSISLALIVHALLSIGILMALACTATPAATPTPSGPMYSEEEAIAVLKQHLQTKLFQSQGKQYPCLLVIEDNIRNPNSVIWDASYDDDRRLWNVTAKSRESWKQLTQQPPAKPKYYTWSVYERTKSIVATGDDPVNQFC